MGDGRTKKRSSDSVEILERNDENVDEGTKSRSDRVWHDSDDEEEKISLTRVRRMKKLRTEENEDVVSGETYKARLEKQFERLHGDSHEWAQLPSKKDDKKKKKKRKSGSINVKNDKNKDDDLSLPISDDEFDLSDIEDEESLSESENEEEDGDKTRTYSDDKIEALLRKSTSLVSKSSSSRRNRLAITKATDGNKQAPSKGVIQALEFHPSRSLLLTASLDKSLRLFEIDGKINRKLHGIQFPDLPILSAHFSSDGLSAFVSGKRSFFYEVDIGTGKYSRTNTSSGGFSEKSLERMILSRDNRYIVFLGSFGYIHILSRNSKQFVTSLKMNGTVEEAAFSPDCSVLVSEGVGGEFYEWDLRMHRCLSRSVDKGALRPCGMAWSNDNQYFASGSGAGVVNLYSGSIFSRSFESESKKHHPVPISVFDNLTTPIDRIRMSNNSTMMGFSSKYVQNGFRLVHLPSKSVYSNWPMKSTPLNYVSDFAFSSDDRWLCVGNDKGRALLYRLQK